MIFSRKSYLNQLIEKPKGSMIKIVTGLRRSGKSFFLFTLYKQYLLQNGVDEEHIIEIILDDRLYIEMRNPDKCLSYIRSRIQDKRWYYLLIDEVQLMLDFVDVLNSCLHIPNLDVYVTGSNSRFLVSDVATEFRGRGSEIRLYPLSFSEYAEVFPDKSWDDMEKPVHKRIEIDFVVNYGYERYYIQSALSLPTTEKRRQEERPLLRVGDGFKKIIITKDQTPLRRTENGITIIGLRQFLSDENSLKL